MLWVATGTEGYGVQRNSLSLMTAAIERGWSVRVTAVQDGPFTRLLEANGIRVTSLAGHAPRSLTTTNGIGRSRELLSWLTRGARVAWRLRRDVERDRPDLVMVRVPSLVAPTAVAVRGSRTAALWHVPSVPSTKPLKINYRLYRLAQLYGRLKIAAGSSRVQADYEAGGLRDVALIPLGIQRSRLASDQPERTARGRGPVRVLVAGRLCREKGQDVLITALARDLSGGRCVLRVLGGDLSSVFAERLRALCEELGVTDSVTFDGFVEEPMLEISEWADVVLAGQIDMEPFGISIVEAMSAGRPVIGYGLGGPEDLIEDGKTGWYAGKGSVSSIRRAFDRAMADASRWEEMGAAARAAVVQRYTADASVRAIEDLTIRPRRGGESHG
jgi:glycosyltransferase involved in cell wall biosynthesis